MKKTTKKIGLQAETLRNLAHHELRDLADHELKGVAGGTDTTLAASHFCSAYSNCI